MKKLLLALFIFAFAVPSYAFNPLQVCTGAVESGESEWLGKTDIGGSTFDLPADATRCSATFTPSGAGTITKISIYSLVKVGGSTCDIKVGLYTDDTTVPDLLVGVPTAFEDVGQYSVGWKDFTVNYAVTAQKYWICINTSCNQFITCNYDGSEGDGNHRDETTDYGDNWSNPFIDSSSSASNYSFKVFIEYD